MPDLLKFLGIYLQARWIYRFSDRRKLESHQKQKLNTFLRTHLPRSPYYRNLKDLPFHSLPIMEKSHWMKYFNEINTVGASLAEVEPLAFAAEEGQIVSPAWTHYAVGLSSGTSGNRGVFLVSQEERIQWAAILFSKILPLRLMLEIFRPPFSKIRLAFFHRAPNRLYSTVGGGFIDFAFYALSNELDVLLSALKNQSPHILVAPAQLLTLFALAQQRGRIAISPRLIISVAEVLDSESSALVQSVFKQPVHQIYQATEGLLATTCARGTLHLNEEYVYFEKEWIDSSHTRFVPIVTDFTRKTQPIVRYRLNDVLRVATSPCPCGSAAEPIAAIEGRCDDILFFRSVNGEQMIPIFPDYIRKIFTLSGWPWVDFRVCQPSPTSLEVSLEGVVEGAALHESVLDGFHKLAKETQTHLPRLRVVSHPVSSLDKKKRRVQRLFNGPDLVL